MCGIAGQYNYLHGEPVDQDRIRGMARAIAHRGPDDEGYFFSGALGLGFRRLSIIDLSGGHQPMSDEEQSVWVVFNGEIFNYKELRAELAARGHKFRTSSDTEVIIHGYKEWGKGVFNKLNGMFGLGIWDVRNRRLLVARDAMGIKLIYYRLEAGQLTFGSEIRAVTAATQGTPEVDPGALNLFLRFRYTPSPHTIFQGIQKLAPGTLLIAEQGTCKTERWYVHTPVPLSPPPTPAAACEELLELYRGAVQRHLLSDVPVGILLSGGLDSGLLLALMNEHGRDWPAYTVGYGDTFADDELRQAEGTARLLGARHIAVRLDREEFERSLPAIVASLEEPITSSSIVPMYFVCQRARQDVKVALIGQGPDELLGGYRRHIGIQNGTTWRNLPAGVRNLIGGAIRRLPRNETLKRGVHALAIEDRLSRYQHVFDLAPSETIDALFKPGILRQPLGNAVLPAWQELLPQLANCDELGAFQMLEIRSSLPDELLMFGDKLSMAHGLEVRVPYLDKTVVEYTQRLPANLKVRNGQGKWLHRKVCERFLAPEILKRKKRGFAVNVVDGWFNDSFKGQLPESLLDPKSLMYQILEPAPVQSLLRDHQSGRQDNHKLLFSLVMVEQWLRSLRANTR